MLERPKLVRKWLKIYLKMRRRINRKKAAAWAFLAFIGITIYCLYEWKVICSNGPIYSAIGMKKSASEASNIFVQFLEFTIPEKKICSLRSLCFVVIVVWHVSFFIDTLCSHFANGKAHGNLCRQFCVTRALQPESCQTFHVGKEVVFSATLQDNSQKVSNIFPTLT